MRVFHNSMISSWLRLPHTLKPSQISSRNLCSTWRIGLEAIVTKNQTVPVKESLEAFFEVDDAPLAAHMTVVQGPSFTENVAILT